jgi:hypothetical protein
MFVWRGSMTDYELRDALEYSNIKMSFSGVSARRGELCSPRGVGLRDSGLRRDTPNGAKAIVWMRDPAVALPGVIPSKIRNLRDSQRLVYDMFQKYGNMTHQELYQHYLGDIDGNAEEIMTASGIRTRCAELVALKLVEQKPHTDYYIANVWGLV